jgi:hypothetical protein
MKELPASETVGMTAFDYPNDQYPLPKPEIKYGDQYVPRPRNHRAMRVEHPKVMRQTLEAK